MIESVVTPHAFAQYAALHHRLLIVDGTDGAGKSTFIKDVLYLHKSFKSKAIQHATLNGIDFHGLDVGHAMIAVGNPALFELLSVLPSVSVALDRGHPSEWVYSRLCHRKQYDAEVLALEKTFAELGGAHVWCRRVPGAGADSSQPQKLTKDKLAQGEVLFGEFYSAHAVAPVFEYHMNDQTVKLRVKK